ncbi:thioredoxin family protein [Blastopirellula sp. JC732]|uniref:Thioredoxin family protein n=1 Tax=Blastopirellula sediminis TaxID=2894196 RepID=A0A9X1SES3_9BACT|nr:thioredoxin family protein [Blastopirellula sediminis]MCC9609686.1 thioredoxin family protein [Blastopirellula sediminis]MCC9627538.1 thioredoxin family protein [Blastopirellula sediminis]
MLKRTLLAIVTLLAISLTQSAYADSPYWYDDYSTAVRTAINENRMLLIYFRAEDEKKHEEFQRVMADPKVAQLLDNYILAELPVNATVGNEDEKAKLLSHGAFQHMYGKSGVAIVDYVDSSDEHYGYVVSQFPFRDNRIRNAQQMQTILGLPRGTLTQRTLIYAVRMHPEAPRSTNGVFRRVLAAATFQHSRLQARMQLQGHHSWDSRFHQIAGQLPGHMLPTEVCAESWPGQNLEDAAIECVRSWRHSSGHWSAVSADNTYYGYDMKRGNNGIWYATGIFAKNR